MKKIEQATIHENKETPFSGKYVVITGAANGIGAALRQETMRLGGLVMGIDVIPQQGLFRADTTNTSELQDVRDRIIKSNNSIDCLILSAGVTQTPGEISQVEEQRVLRINVDGTKNTFEVFRPLLRKNATVVFIGTDNPPSTKPVYAVSKKRVEDYAIEKGKEFSDIRIITLKPGPIDTNLFRQGKPADVANRIIQEIGLSASEFAEIVVGDIIPNREDFPSGSQIRIYKDKIEVI